MASIPFLTGKPEKPKSRDFRHGDKLYLKQQCRIFPELTPDILATVIPYIDPAHGIETHPVHSAANPTVLVQFEGIDGRQFAIPYGQLETKEQRQWRLDHPDDPVPDPQPSGPNAPAPLPPAGSMALPLPEESIDTDAVSKQTVGT